MINICSTKIQQVYTELLSVVQVFCRQHRQQQWPQPLLVSINDMLLLQLIRAYTCQSVLSDHILNLFLRIKCVVSPVLTFSSSAAFNGFKPRSCQGLTIQCDDPTDQHHPWQLYALSHPRSQCV